uniref:Docking protein 3 n=1 Tax=Sphenodon punctatus TaxID=8508 RepID=A0A8D0GML0_SPHPU
METTPSTYINVGGLPSSESKMEENVIYSTWQNSCEFLVLVIQTLASNTCGLKGNYLLVTSPERLELKNPQSRQTILTWPYPFLRRFGRDKAIFSFEAGRRCESGEGLFSFNTSRANEIYNAVSAIINRQMANLQGNSKTQEASATLNSTQGAGYRSWSSSSGNLEEMQLLCAGSLQETGGAQLLLGSCAEPTLAPPVTKSPDPPIIYATIERSLQPPFQPSVQTEDKCGEPAGQISDHLYENLCALEHAFLPGAPALNLSCRGSPEGSSNSDPDPIYDNSLVVPKQWSNPPAPTPSAGPDSSLEAQYQRLLDQEVPESGEEGEGDLLMSALPKAKSETGFKRKLITLLSREGVPKAPTTSLLDKP